MTLIPTHALTGDFAVFNHIGEILLVRRKNDPFKGMLALPGGFAEPNETGKDAAIRELYEETNIIAQNDKIGYIGIYDLVNRDPRGPVISMAYWTIVPDFKDAKAKDDAAELVIRTVSDINEKLAFDHDRILDDASMAIARVTSNLLRKLNQNQGLTKDKIDAITSFVNNQSLD